MRWIYCCPHCSAMLNPAETITLISNVEGTRVLVGLHPQPGNYEVYLPPSVDLVPGTTWEFFCPVCGHTLVTDVSESLCALDMHTGGDLHRVYFSRIAGERATFVVTAEGLLSDYGIHTDRYLEQLVHRMYRR